MSNAAWLPSLRWPASSHDQPPPRHHRVRPVSPQQLDLRRFPKRDGHFGTVLLAKVDERDMIIRD